MFAESHPKIRRVIRFFLLPYCFFKLVNWKQCTVSPLKVAIDLFTLFFSYRIYPDHYTPCRLWEKSKKEWALFYGSNYDPYPRWRFRKKVQPYKSLALFKDKAQCEAFFSEKGIPMPRIFGNIIPKDNIKQKLDDIFKNSGLKQLILKPLNGSAGRGVVKAFKNENSITIIGKNLEASANKFAIDEEYLIQEVVLQHEAISAIAPHSVNTVRTISLLTMHDNVIILSASMRFGVGKTFVDNWSAGGVGVGVNFTDGVLMKYAYDKHGNAYEYHPTSGIQFIGYKIPFWKEVCELTAKTQEASPFHRLMGLDIALTPQGPIVIEINSSPDLVFQEQTAGPLLANPTTLEAFGQYDLLYNKHQLKMYRELLNKRPPRMNYEKV